MRGGEGKEREGNSRGGEGKERKGNREGGRERRGREK